MRQLVYLLIGLNILSHQKANSAMNEEESMCIIENGGDSNICRGGLQVFYLELGNVTCIIIPKCHQFRRHLSEDWGEPLVKFPEAKEGVSVDMMEDYKYLGIRIDNKLDWSKNTEAVYKKGQSRLYFLRRLRSSNICRTMLRMFYESVVPSAIMFAVVCWGSRLRVADTNRINKLIRKASDVVGMELDSLTVVSEKRMLSKLYAILVNVSHPLHNVLGGHRSTFSQRLIPPRCNTERHRKSFLPVAIKLYNSSLGGSDTLSQ
ncbi:uncharacterized protein LOC134350989 isoform X1 [Mobula hypostoma]|uniref:uncharacterized protein LOC134350989 isoform X1 n=1 Tax=Mobula hypostoma TaxID=723540 RepID=UPI002FC37BF6